MSPTGVQHINPIRSSDLIHCSISLSFILILLVETIDVPQLYWCLKGFMFLDHIPIETAGQVSYLGDGIWGCMKIGPDHT